MSRDPIGEGGGFNLFAFVGNGPLTRVDALGREAYPSTFWTSAARQNFWDDWTPEQRQAWFTEFREKYGEFIKQSARQHCVPRKLLAAVIANEMLDYPGHERFTLDTFKNASVGPAQIDASDIISNGLADEYDEPLSFEEMAMYDPGLPPDQRTRIQHALRDPKTNIDAAARIMGKYLDQLCHDSKSGALGQGFLVQIATGCRTDHFCCRRKSGSDCSDVPIPLCLMRAMSAIWDYNYGITKSPNVRVGGRIEETFGFVGNMSGGSSEDDFEAVFKDF